MRGRVRFAPVPRAWAWNPRTGCWEDSEARELWADVPPPPRRRVSRRSRNARGRQLELDLPLGTGSGDLPPRPLPHAATARLWAQVPPRWRTLLAPVGHSPWRCLLFLHHLGSPAEDLFASNPTLAWLLANQIDPSDWRCMPDLRTDLLHHLAGKQHKLLHMLDLPAEKWVVKLLGKLEIRASPGSTLQNVRRVMRHPEVHKGFQHLERVRSSHLGLVDVGTAPLLQPSLLRELGAYDAEHPEWLWYRDILRDIGSWRLRGVKVPVFSRMRDLIRWALSEQERNKHTSVLLQRVHEEFPPPPFPGDEVFVPIRDPRELKLEGRFMRHCVNTYLRKVEVGAVCVYKVLAPERATLGLRRVSALHWEILDLKCVCNQRPSAATVAAVNTWLAANHAKLMRQSV